MGCVAVFLVLASAHALAALDASVTDVRASAASLRATVELKDVLSDRFRRLLDQGGTLHLLIQTELWEDRPAWDRLVQPTVSSAFRISRDRSTGAVLVQDAVGAVSRLPREIGRMPIQVHVAPVASVEALRRYYVHVIATIGTVAEREIDEVGEAVFGPDEEAGGLESVGKYVVRKFLQINSYLQSSSAETTSRKFKGADVSK
jgi:hypothetical protein